VPVSRETVPDEVTQHYPEAAPALLAFHGLLAADGVERGLIGPREAPRLWERHLLNCAVVEQLIPTGTVTLADVGSGAGLPGIVLALVRPELHVSLIEPLERRSLFLAEAVDFLGISDRVGVVRGRAETVAPAQFDCVTARAVAPLDRLVRWCLPLLHPGRGRLLAMKGERAEQEVDEARTLLRPTPEMSVVRCGEGMVHPPTTVVVVRMTGSGNPPDEPQEEVRDDE